MPVTHNPCSVRMQHFSGGVNWVLQLELLTQTQKCTTSPDKYLCDLLYNKFMHKVTYKLYKEGTILTKVNIFLSYDISFVKI